MTALSRNSGDLTLLSLLALLGALAGALASKSLRMIAELNPWVMAVLPAAAFLLALTLFRPALVLLLVLFTRAWLDPVLEMTKFSLGGAELGAGVMINLLALGFTAFLAIRSPRLLAGDGLGERWLFFLAFVLIALLHSPDTATGLKLFENLACYMCFALLPRFFVSGGKDHDFWIRALLLSSVPAMIYANVDLAKGGQEFADAGNRISGSFTHPNILAYYLVLMLVIFFYAAKRGILQTKGAKGAWALLYIVDLLVLLIATKARGAWFAAWALFFCFGLLRSRKYLWISVLLPPFLLLDSDFRDRILEILLNQTAASGSVDSINSMNWRLILWGDSLSLILRNPLFGNGLASFAALSPMFSMLVASDGFAAAHNVYLELMFETGIFGLSAFLSLILFPVKRFWKAAAEVGPLQGDAPVILMLCVVYYALICLSDNILCYLAMNWYFWFFVGLGLRGIESDRIALEAP